MLEEYIDYLYDISDAIKDMVDKLREILPNVLEKGSGLFPK